MQAGKDESKSAAKTYLRIAWLLHGPLVRRLIFVLIVKIIKEIECENELYFGSVISFDGLVVLRSVHQIWLTKWLCTYYGLQLRCF